MRGATLKGVDTASCTRVSIHAPHAGRDIASRMVYEDYIVSIHAPHAGRDLRLKKSGTHYAVSIHAPHAGRDLFLHSDSHRIVSFNPRAPCGARPPVYGAQDELIMFQSTRPMRGATCITSWSGDCANVSIHAPHAGRDPTPSVLRGLYVVSIHAPHAGRDSGVIATTERREVSIHAPHAGRDFFPMSSIRRVLSFNPRAPCGARPRMRA